MLFDMVKRSCYQNFRQHLERVCEPLVPEGEQLGSQHLRNLFYGNYIEPDAEPKIYDEVVLLYYKKQTPVGDCLY